MNFVFIVLIPFLPHYSLLIRLMTLYQNPDYVVRRATVESININGISYKLALIKDASSLSLGLAALSSMIFPNLSKSRYRGIVFIL